MSSYWAKRADERITEAHNDLTLNIKEALVSYDQSLIEIESDIKRLLFKGNLEMYDLNDVLSVQASKKEVDNLFSMLEKATNKNEIKRLKNEISKLAYKARITRLTAIKANIEARVAHLGGVTENLIRDKLTTTAGVMYDKTIFDLQQQIGFAFPFMKSSNEMIDTIINQDWSGKHWSERVWANSKELSVNLFDTMIKGVAQGKSYYVMSKELKDKMQSSEYAAVRLIRTETSYVANRSKLNAYITNGIEKYEFVAVLDARTSEICQDNDGSIVELKDAVFGLTLPPLHPNCRSTFIALIEPKYKASLKRLSVNPITGEKEKIPRDMTYREWKQSLYEKYGRDRVENSIARMKNTQYDKNQLGKYQSVLGSEVPDNVEDFQNIKYNNPNKWEEIQDHYFVKSRIKNGHFGSKINNEKQLPHIQSTALKGKSYLFDNVDAQELFNKYAGTGKVLKNTRGIRIHQELIDCGKIIGVDVQAGRETSLIKIHHSNSRTHIVPFAYKLKESI